MRLWTDPNQGSAPPHLLAPLQRFEKGPPRLCRMRRVSSYDTTKTVHIGRNLAVALFVFWLCY